MQRTQTFTSISAVAEADPHIAVVVVSLHATIANEFNKWGENARTFLVWGSQEIKTSMQNHIDYFPNVLRYTSVTCVVTPYAENTIPVIERVILVHQESHRIGKFRKLAVSEQARSQPLARRSLPPIPQAPQRPLRQPVDQGAPMNRVGDKRKRIDFDAEPSPTLPVHPLDARSRGDTAAAIVSSDAKGSESLPMPLAGGHRLSPLSADFLPRGATHTSRRESVHNVCGVRVLLPNVASNLEAIGQKSPTSITACFEAISRVCEPIAAETVCALMNGSDGAELPTVAKYTRDALQAIDAEAQGDTKNKIFDMFRAALGMGLHVAIFNGSVAYKIHRTLSYGTTIYTLTSHEGGETKELAFESATSITDYVFPLITSSLTSTFLAIQDTHTLWRDEFARCQLLCAALDILINGKDYFTYTPGDIISAPQCMGIRIH